MQILGEKYTMNFKTILKSFRCGNKTLATELKTLNDFIFTGNIKYTIYKDITFVSFEVTFLQIYIDKPNNLWEFLTKRYKKELIKKTAYFNEDCFRTQEIPKEIIYTCS
jgi:hypothetical protein